MPTPQSTKQAKIVLKWFLFAAIAVVMAWSTYVLIKGSVFLAYYGQVKNSPSNITAHIDQLHPLAGKPPTASMDYSFYLNGKTYHETSGISDAFFNSNPTSTTVRYLPSHPSIHYSLDDDEIPAGYYLWVGWGVLAWVTLGAAYIGIKRKSVKSS